MIKSRLKILIAFILTLSITFLFFGCGEAAEEKETTSLTASSFTQTANYNAGEEISIDFSVKFTNTTGNAIAYLTNIGEIGSNGIWKYTPQTAQSVIVYISATADDKVAFVRWSLTVGGDLAALPFAQTETYNVGSLIAIDFSQNFVNKTSTPITSYSTDYGTIINGVWFLAPETAYDKKTIKVEAFAGENSAFIEWELTVSGVGALDYTSVLYTDYEPIEIDFSNYFINTTGKALIYSASYGNIDSDGKWTFTPAKDYFEKEIIIIATTGLNEETALLYWELTVGTLFALDWQDEQYLRAGEETDIDFSANFVSINGLALSFSSDIGTINNQGIWTYTADSTEVIAEGSVSVVITVTDGEKTVILNADVEIRNPLNAFYRISNDSDLARYRLNDQELTISTNTVPIGSQVRINNAKAGFNMMVPASSENPVLYFYFTGDNSTRLAILAYNLASGEQFEIYGYNNGEGNGLGVASAQPKFFPNYQLYAFELNPVFTLEEQTEIRFIFDEYGSSSSSRNSTIALPVVVSKNDLDTVNGPYGQWAGLYTDAENNTITSENNVITLTAKGVENASGDVMVAAYIRIKNVVSIPSRDIKLLINGTAQYKVYFIAMDYSGDETNTVTMRNINPNGAGQSSSGPNWHQANSEGDVVFWDNGRGTGDNDIYLLVYIKASDVDTFITIDIPVITE